MNQRCTICCDTPSPIENLGREMGRIVSKNSWSLNGNEKTEWINDYRDPWHHSGTHEKQVGTR